MRVLVSDSSILIEFSKREILEKMFELDFQFAVPDLLFNEELIDLGPYSRQDLLDFGLRVESLDADGVQTAISYQAERTALSLVDSFALALAGVHGWRLLTEDKPMRRFAELKQIAHLDALWVVDRLVDTGLISDSHVLAVLEAMHFDPRSPVPKLELTARIRRLRV